MDLSDILEQLDDETLKEIAGDATDYTSEKGIEDLLETVYNNAYTKAINNFIKFHVNELDIDDVLDEFEPDDIINYLNNKYDYKFEA